MRTGQFRPRSVALYLLGIAGLAVLLNVLVDPYEVFGTPRIPGLSARKPSIRPQMLLAKTYQLSRVHPVTVVIGGTATGMGIDAQAPEWPVAMQPVYNFGLPGAQGLSTSLRTLQEALAGGSVRNAVVFLDFQSFLVPERPDGPAAEETEYHYTADSKRAPGRGRQAAVDMALAALTPSALIDSVQTIAAQIDPAATTVDPDGSVSESEFIAVARAKGMHALFAPVDAYEIERAEGLKRTMAGWEGGIPNLEIVGRMIDLAHAHQVALTFVLAPHHGDALEVYWRYGLWPRVEQLKTEIAELTAGRTGDVTLWDFLDYSGFNTESVPAEGDRRTPTSWFWEPEHYKRQLGEVMVQRMFGQDAPTFGQILTPHDVEDHNARIRAHRQVLVCEPHDARLLTALAMPLPSGCETASEARNTR